MPDPPRFKRCVKAELRRLRRVKRRETRPALRRRCRRRYAGLRSEVMQFLLQARWVRQEAAARGIAVSPKEFQREFQSLKQGAFETEREYRRFLRRSGQREADLHYRVELSMLQSRLTDQAVGSPPPVTREDVDEYYSRHRRRFRGMTSGEARSIIRDRLTSIREKRALRRYTKDFRSRYRRITVCAGGYLVAECGNARSP